MTEVSDVLGFKGVSDCNRSGYFFGNNDKTKKQRQLINVDYLADITAGTNIFFNNCNIIEHQHLADVKAPFFRVINTERRLANSNLQIPFAAKHKSPPELQFEKLVLNTIWDFSTELVAVSGENVPFVGTGHAAIT